LMSGSNVTVPLRISGAIPRDLLVNVRAHRGPISGKRITLLSRYCVTNKLSQRIRCSFVHDTGIPSSVLPESTCPLHRMSEDSDESSLTLDIPDYHPVVIPIGAIDAYPVFLRPKMDGSTQSSSKSGPAPLYLFVSVDQVNSSTSVTISSITLNEPPFIIQNHLKERLVIKQTDTKCLFTVYPGESMPFAWAEPSKQRTIDIAGCQVDVSRAVRTIPVMNQLTEMYVEVRLRGACRVVHIRPTTTVKKNCDAFLFTLECTIPSIVLSYINNEPQEMLLLTIEGLKASFAQTKTKHIIQCSVNGLQLDDQLHEAFIPVVLSTDRWTHDREHQFFGQPFLSLNVHIRRGTRNKKKASSLRPLIYIHTLALMVTPIDLQLEELLVSRLLGAWNSIQKGLTDVKEGSEKMHRKQVMNSGIIPATASAFNVSNGMDALLALREEEKKASSTALVFIEDLMISELLLVVSFAKSESSTSSDSLTFLSSHFGALIKLNDAFLPFTALSARNIDGTSSSIFARISSHYKEQFSRITVKLVFSTEFMGNPMSMFRDFKTGVNSLKEGEVGKFLMYGVAGVSNSAGSFSSYAGSQLRQISGDNTYIRKTKPTNLSEGAKEGAKSLGLGFLRGVAGLFSTPIEKVQEKGARGFVPGVLQGVVGVVAHPVAGVFDMIGSTTQGLHSQIVGANVLERRRYPRFIASNKIVTPFNGLLSFYQYLLTSVNPKYKMKSYVEIPMPGNEKVTKLILLSSFDYSLVCFEITGFSSASLVFEFPANKLKGDDKFDVIMKSVPPVYLKDSLAVSQITEVILKQMEHVGEINSKASKTAKPFFL